MFRFTRRSRPSILNGGLLASAVWIAYSLPASAQQLNVGIVAGTNLTDDVRSGTETYSGGILPSGETQSSTYVVHPGERRPILGIRLRFDLSRAWALEFDALHREWKSSTDVFISPPVQLPNGSTLSGLGTLHQTLTTWEFPVMVKYEFQLRRFHPFFALGPSFRPGGSGTGLSHVGAGAGAGLEFRARRFRISPTVRYTRWVAKPVGFIYGAPLRNQVELLVAVDHTSGRSAARVFGRRLSLGVIAGIGFGRDFRVGDANSGQTAEGNSGIFGVALEAPLSSRWAVEVDGLYRPLHGSELEFDRPVRFAHLTWEFPVLAKYRFAAMRGLAPFVAAGPSFRAEGNLNLQSVSHFGAAAAVGVETKWRFLKLAPSLRYTRWGAAGNSAVSRTEANQVYLLFSLAF